MLDIIILVTMLGRVGSMTPYIMEVEISSRFLFLFIRDGVILLRPFFWNALCITYSQFSCYIIDLVKFGQRWLYLTSDMMNVLIVFYIQLEESIVLVPQALLTCPTIVISRSSVMKGLVKSVIEILKGSSSFPPRESVL